MSLKSVLLKIALAVLNNILNTIAQQLQRLIKEVNDPINSYINSIVDEVWEGEDADAFKAELQQVVKPTMEAVTNVTKRTHEGIVAASEVIDAADKRVSQLVDNLKSEFAKIY